MKNWLFHFVLVIATFSSSVRGQDDPASTNISLADAISWVSDARSRAAQIDEYSCLLCCDERIEGKQRERAWFRIKVRNDPLKIYAKCVKGARRRVEYLFDETKNRGKVLVADRTGMDYWGPAVIDPKGFLLMRWMRRPFTEWDICSTTDHLIQILKMGQASEGIKVNLFKKGKVTKRDCTVLKVRYLRRTNSTPFHMVSLYVDDELKIPVRIAVYDWPKTEKEEPELVEAYTFVKMDIEPGFSDKEFDKSSFGQ